RRDSPGDDLTTRLIEAAGDGRLATQDELVMNTGALLIAGFETTTNLITNAVYNLLEHSVELAKLRADPTSIAAAVEEVLRFDPPVQMLSPRTMTAETVLGGAELHPGDAVVPIMAAANRDPAEFDDPDRFDITRSRNRHLSFGLGHHMCVGSSLARMETQAAVSRLFERFPALALDPGDPPEYRPNLALRGFSRLPVSLA
ncbi:MAG TPA: cytochrome P450, partial [Acidimicrobiia bacterium]|nr:cytochrome P450 [Acidimicrobiia bacterium]